MSNQPQQPTFLTHPPADFIVIGIHTIAGNGFFWKWDSNSKRYIKSRPVKSVACSKVLQLMDEDHAYKTALKTVCEQYPCIKKEVLEEELNIYI